MLTWISHGCTRVPHPEPQSQRTGIECPISSIKLGLVIYFTYGNIHVSLLFSQIIPSSPSPTESKSPFFISVSLLLSCIYGHCYHLSKFHIYALIYYIGWEKAMAPHSSTLAWKIPWTEEPSRLKSMESLRVGHDWATSLSLFTFLHWRRKWQPTPVLLPGKSHGQRSLVGCSPWSH